MEFRQLQAFCVLAQLEHMSLTAQNLGTSQPQISKLISSLEVELGVPLFDRVGRGIRLNEHGRLFLPYANNALDVMNGGQMTMRNLKNSILGTVTLSTLAFSSILTPAISVYLKRNPNVCFQCMPSGSTIHARANNADLLLSFSMYRHYSYEAHFPIYRILLEEEYYIVASPQLLDYPPEKDTITLSEVENTPIVIMGASSQDRNNDYGILQDIGDALGTSFPIACIANEFSQKMTLVAECVGIALLPRACLSLARQLVPNLRVFSIEDFITSRSVIIARKKRDSMSVAANHFWDFLLEYYNLPEDYEN